jgi:feruloyl esterase
LVLDQCDGQDGDGLKDGIITDPTRCKIDLRPLLCTSTTKPGTCLTPAQHATLEKLMRPAFAGGTPGYFGYRLSGSDRDVGPSWGWPKWFFGTLPPVLDRSGRLAYRGDALPPDANRGVGPNQFLLGEQFFRYLVVNDPGYDARTFSMRTGALELERKLGGLLNANQTDLGPFIRLGGKLLIWHGWADPAIPPDMSIDLYKRIQRATPHYAGQTPTDQAVRLFMLPGVQHCGGGAGLTAFDPLGAMEKWVEGGEAPDRLTASQLIDDKPGRSRPVCPYPKIARYVGHGNVDEAANFECR